MSKFPYTIRVYNYNNNRVFCRAYRNWYLADDQSGLDRSSYDHAQRLLKKEYGLKLSDDWPTPNKRYEVFIIANEQDELNYSAFCLEWS